MRNIFRINGLAKLDELSFPDHKFKWQDPWWNLEEKPDLRLNIQKELNAEIGPKHLLWGLKPVVFGKCDGSDGVVVYLNNGGFAHVHLVWHGKIDLYPTEYPFTTILESVLDVQGFLDSEAEEYT